MKYRIKWSWNFIVNIILVLLFLFIAIPRIEMWIFSPEMEGRLAPKIQVLDLSGHEFEVPMTGQNQVLLFWATWCGPCTAELALYNHAVKEKKLSAGQVLAISIGENLETVRAAALERGYEFSVYLDPGGMAAQNYQVKATPTSVFVDKAGQISSYSTGLSPLSFIKAESFLKE